MNTDLARRGSPDPAAALTEGLRFSPPDPAAILTAEGPRRGKVSANRINFVPLILQSHSKNTIDNLEHMC